MKKITIESSYSIFAIGLNSISNFVLTYFVAKSLSIESIGALSFSLSIITFFTGVLIFGFDSAVGRIFWDTHYYNHRSKIFCTWVYSTGIYSILICLGLYFILQNTNTFKIETYRVGILTYALIPGKILIFLVFNWIRIDGKSLLFLKLSIINFILLIFFVCLPAYFLSLNLDQLLTLTFFTTYVFLIFVFYLLRADLSPLLFDKKILFEIYNLSKPLIFVLLIMQLFPFVDRLYIKKFMNEQDLGTYHLHLTLASIFGMVTSATQQFLGPKVMEIYSNEVNSIKVFNKLREYTFFLFSILLLLFIILAKYLFILFFPGYKFDLTLFSLIVYNFLLVFLFSFSNYSLFINKNNGIIANGWYIAFIIKIFILAVLYEHVNTYSLMLASSISYISLILYLYKKSQKSLKIWVNQWSYLFLNLILVFTIITLIYFYE